MADPSHRNTDRAYEPKKPSASDASTSDIVFGRLISESSSSEPLDAFDIICDSYYDLEQLAVHLHPIFNLEEFNAQLPKKRFKLAGSQEAPSQLNENVAKFCVEACTEACTEVGLDIRINEKVPQLDNLPALYCTTFQRPDVAVYQRKSLLLTIEVHSSPFNHTLRKTIIGGIDMLRLLRNADPSVTEFTSVECCVLLIRGISVAQLS